MHDRRYAGTAWPRQTRDCYVAEPGRRAGRSALCQQCCSSQTERLSPWGCNLTQQAPTGALELSRVWTIRQCEEECLERVLVWLSCKEEKSPAGWARVEACA